MPTAPLYYQPLVQAAIQSVPLGSSTLGEVAKQQASFAFIAPAPGAERQIHPVTEAALAIATDPALKAGVEKSMTGIAGLTDARRGARLDGVNLNATDESYIASRTLSTIRDNPIRLDMASPDEAAAMAQNVMQQVARSGTQRPVIQSGVLDLPANISNAIMQAWKQQPTGDEDVAAAGLSLARTIEEADLPIANAGSWMSESVPLALATWKGAVSAAATAMGFANDPAKIESIITTWRTQAQQLNPAAGSLYSLLGLAGFDPTVAEHRPAVLKIFTEDPTTATFQLAQGIASKAGIAPDKAEWLAGRIEDINGRPGNIDGLVAQIAALRQSHGQAPVPAPTPAPMPAPPAAPPTPAPAPEPAPAPTPAP